MKTSRFSLLFATLSLAATLGTTVYAGGNSTDTKHSTISICTRSTSSTSSVSDEYAKFLWLDSADQVQVNHIIVSLADQRLYAYRDQQLVAWSNISSGRPGHETPTGTFTVSEKDVDHHSNLYENAPMPYFMRLTDGGVGMHAGQLPGYPASHGCVRLPSAMARELYQRVESGTPVEITSQSVSSTMAQTTTTPTAVHLVQD